MKEQIERTINDLRKRISEATQLDQVLILTSHLDKLYIEYGQIVFDEKDSQIFKTSNFEKFQCVCSNSNELGPWHDSGCPRFTPF